MKGTRVGEARNAKKCRAKWTERRTGGTRREQMMEEWRGTEGERSSRQEKHNRVHNNAALLFSVSPQRELVT